MFAKERFAICSNTCTGRTRRSGAPCSCRTARACRYHVAGLLLHVHVVQRAFLDVWKTRPRSSRTHRSSRGLPTSMPGRRLTTPRRAPSSMPWTRTRSPADSHAMGQRARHRAGPPPESPTLAETMSRSPATRPTIEARSTHACARSAASRRSWTTSPGSGTAVLRRRPGTDEDTGSGIGDPGSDSPMGIVGSPIPDPGSRSPDPAIPDPDPDPDPDSYLRMRVPLISCVVAGLWMSVAASQALAQAAPEAERALARQILGELIEIPTTAADDGNDARGAGDGGPVGCGRLRGVGRARARTESAHGQPGRAHPRHRSAACARCS